VVLRMAEAAQLLGVSDDTLRRWVDSGRVAGSRTPSGKAGIAGTDLAALARELAAGGTGADAEGRARVSARNRLRGIVTDVRRDEVMAQIELCCGPYRVVSLMSREAADELRLQPGVVAVASVKATTVVVELA
jgi:molybdopterin-binding protein